MKKHLVPLLCLVFVTIVFVWSAWKPEADRLTWWMEVIPALIALPLLLATYRWFRLTSLLYVLIALHACILMIGGHYTYANVPLFNWLRDYFGTTRNSFDGVGHFMQGFVPAMIGRELLLRTSPLRAGKWMAALLVLGCLGIAAIYEIIEWAAALATGEGATAFLGTQGDPWDTQKDMILAGIGAACALLLCSRWHDRQLSQL